MTTFGERLRAARDLRGIGANELGRAIGQGAGYVSKLEKGGRGSPTAENAAKLAAALRVKLDWLTTGKGPMEAGSTPPEPSPATVAPVSPEPASPAPLSPTPTSPGIANPKKVADERWRVFAAGRPMFSAAASETMAAAEAREARGGPPAHHMNKVLDAAADRLTGGAPTYEESRAAIREALAGVARAAELLEELEGIERPGTLIPRLVGEASGKVSSPRS